MNVSAEHQRLLSDLVCAGCQSSVAGRLAFTIGGEARCLRCSLTYAPLLWRSLYTSLVVGSVLVLINQGNIFLAGDVSTHLLWKVPLTYAVPFCVASWGALINSRLRP